MDPSASSSSSSSKAATTGLGSSSSPPTPDRTPRGGVGTTAAAVARGPKAQPKGLGMGSTLVPKRKGGSTASTPGGGSSMSSTPRGGQKQGGVTGGSGLARGAAAGATGATARRIGEGSRLHGQGEVPARGSEGLNHQCAKRHRPHGILLSTPPHTTPSPPLHYTKGHAQPGILHKVKHDMEGIGFLAQEHFKRCWSCVMKPTGLTACAYVPRFERSTDKVQRHWTTS
jgi:hypothetical protein